ncbi:unnamed protein product [Clonostachys byssicola]|uniref:Nucleoside phosphorylase domain-containing protein n=1 Tax=Clonostachys byssicola TaxID=160290 RepID=A0A9N9XZ48_9HYPO|nr:unnamed protein product [Clonostachys byssicola]
MSPTEFVHSDYTVGWVCALPKEQTAATAMLDHIHPDLPKPPTDHNTYTLGSVENHNVVIACLPKGKYGTNSAATVATRMLDTFPSIKFGLMVGIGGGIPPNVRLGDVVVSTPIGQYPGVVQWDFGKAEKGGHFERVGALNNPPSALLTALSKLETAHDMKGSQIPRYLDEMGAKWPELVPKYIKSDSFKDPLLSSMGLRDDRDGWWALLSIIWAAIVDLVKRLLGWQAFAPNRPAVENSAADGGGQKAPRGRKVHYGLIASGNQVIKDAVFRDNLNCQLGGNVLCLEMEAAGLANDFPCIVIRGICDYADSGKNKEWQEHAAAVAAAFAKDLLSVVPAQEVSQMSNAKRIDTKLDEVSKNVADLRCIQRNQEHQAILDWLTPIEYAPKQNDNLRSREPGTGQWLLDSKEYQAWLKTSKQTLFCPGIPGAGKTILTSVVIDDLGRRCDRDSTIGIAYMYCNFREQDNHRIDNVLASLLKQLAERRPSLPEVIKDLYDRHKPKKTRPLVEEISRTLQSLANTYLRVYFIVDALDECQESDGSRAELLKKLFALQGSCSANLFMTSRMIPDIQESFKESFLELEIRASNEDVGRYIDSRIDSLSKLVRSDLQLREDIKAEVTKAVSGMFLLAELHLNSLKGCYTATKVRRALKALPTGSTAYDETYEAAMERIGSQTNTKGFAASVLAWITLARRPFKTSELRHALAVEVGEAEFDQGNLPHIDDVVAVCAGLVVVDKESDIVRLVHYTTQQYFERTQRDWFPSAEADITAACVTYLSYETFKSGGFWTQTELEQRLSLHKFYDYAANNWGHHARTSLSTSQQLIEFLESNEQAEAAAHALMVMTESWDYKIAPRMKGLHLAAYFGIAEAIGALLGHVKYSDIKDSYGWTPLAWAAMKKHDAVIKLLLENGADADSMDANDRTPLSLAAEKGHEAIVGLLLATERVNVDSKDKMGNTPLLYAAENDHGAVVNLLLTTGKVDIYSESFNTSRTPAWVAVELGHTEVVKQFLSIGKFDVNSKRGIGSTPLIHAVTGRHENLVKMLLATDKIRVDMRDKFDQTPLSYAAKDGLEAIAKLLINIGKADVNLKDVINRTPLLLATENRDERMVELLLSSGQTPVDVKSNTETTPLHCAAYDGSEEIVRLLLATGKSGINILDGYNRSPLLIAADHGHESIVRLLLATGQADVDAKDSSGRTPLLCATQGWHKAIVRLLLEHGADSNTVDRYGKSPLSMAGSNEAIAKMLQAAAAKRDNLGQTLAPFPAERGHDAVVQLVLKSKGCVESNVNSSHMLPSWATEYDEMVKLQLATGRFDMDAKDQDGSTLLLYSSKHGHEGVVKLLLATSVVDINMTNNSGQTPLSCAVESGYEPIVRLLIATGKTNRFSGFSPETYAALLQHKAMSNLFLTAFDGNANAEARSGSMLLNIAEYEAMFRLLIATGNFDIHMTNSGITLLWLAARNGHESLLKLLLDTGRADINRRYMSGLTLLCIAAIKGHENIVNLLLSTGEVDINLRDDSGKTPLHWAATVGHLGVVDLLLATDKADIDARDNTGNTAISIARTSGYQAVVSMLLGTGGIIVDE